MRYLKSNGLSTDWALVEIFATVAIALTPVMILVRARVSGHWLPLAAAGLTGGVAMTAYYLSVTQTAVARATLLFYLAPVWTTLIEASVTRRWPQPITLIEIVLSLSGLAAIFGPSGGHGMNSGDVLAGLAVLAFAGSSIAMARWPQPRGVGFTWAWAISSLTSAGVGVAFDPEPRRRGGGPILATALLMFMPMNILALWGARQLHPTKVSLLMTCEVVVAAVSSALFANDPIGPREVAGCLLILLAMAVGPCVPQLRRSIRRSRIARTPNTLAGSEGDTQNMPTQTYGSDRIKLRFRACTRS